MWQTYQKEYESKLFHGIFNYFKWHCSLLYWTVPFLCWMAIVVFMFAMLLTYHVSLRYIILTWGINNVIMLLCK